jgi:phenylacetic acid degradation operon negative regulatory protein
LLQRILERLKTQPSRTGSVIVTLFGDAILPRGGTLALASLLDIFRMLDINDGVVRTAVSRLGAEGWIERIRIGRNAFYRLSPRAIAATDAAIPRIYGPAPIWDGKLRLVLDPGPERAALIEQGYGTLAPNLLLSPTGAHATLTAEAPAETLPHLAARAWPLVGLAARYESFLDTFPPDTPTSAAHALPLRLLLIHEFRRIALRDPQLPVALLPSDWPGHPARRRAALLYARLHPDSENWLDRHASSIAGPLPPPVSSRQFL